MTEPLAPLYRVQDDDGRGPWRPGFSHRWVDQSSAPLPPPFLLEFGWSVASLAHRVFPGESIGCGCRSLAQLARWLSPAEARKLRRAGYRVVRIVPTRILGESENQVVFARMTKLRDHVDAVDWIELEHARGTPRLEPR